MSCIKKLARVTVIAASLGLPFAQVAAEPQQFELAEQMFEEFGDYSVSNESLNVLKTDPLHVRLTRPVMDGDHPSVVESELKRAVVYGIYQSFIHTDTDQITVTAQPMLTTFNPRSQKLLDKPAYEISITRDQALDAAQAFLAVDNLSELKVEGQFGLTWSDDFNNLYYEDRSPG